MPTDGDRRRAAIGHEMFAAAAQHAALLSGGLCAIPRTPEGIAAMARIFHEASSGGSAEGRWLLADMLVVFLTTNLNQRGIFDRTGMLARIQRFTQAPAATDAQMAAAFAPDMRDAYDFVAATLDGDFDAAMALTDKQDGPYDKVLYMLAGLIVGTCPVHVPGA